jgi:hypothetical protein
MTSCFARVAAVAALIAILSPGGVVGAVETHSHGDPAGGVQGLTLDHGRKWQTDAPLRAGMAGIRNDMAAALGPIHAKRYSAGDYDALAGAVTQRIDAIARDCRLPEATDAQLHLVLAEIIDGVEVMRGRSPDRSLGAAGVVGALDRYQAHFDHPGWQPVGH